MSQLSLLLLPLRNVFNRFVVLAALSNAFTCSEH